MRIRIFDAILDESKRQESTIRSSLIVLLLHMLKCKYQNNYPDKTSWRYSIINSYNKMLNEFDGINKGSLYKTFYMKKLDLNDIYKRSLIKAVIETRLPKSSFPSTCEWSKEELVNLDFIEKFINDYGYESSEN